MKGRRIVALALAAVALTAGGFALGACGSKPADAQKPRTQMSPEAALDAAIDDLGRSAYAVEITAPGAGAAGAHRESGVIDPATGAGTLDSTATVQGVATQLDAVMLTPDIWVKLDLGDRNGQYGISRQAWMKLDAARTAGASRLPVDLNDFHDALDMKKLLAGVDAKRADAGRLTGVIDLTRATGVTAPEPSAVASAGARARSLPISIAFDEQGRLIEVNIDGNASPALGIDIRFSDYGMRAKVSRPDDDQIVPTPDTVYQLLSGRKPA